MIIRIPETPVQVNPTRLIGAQTTENLQKSHETRRPEYIEVCGAHIQTATWSSISRATLITAVGARFRSARIPLWQVVRYIILSASAAFLARHSARTSLRQEEQFPLAVTDSCSSSYRNGESFGASHVAERRDLFYRRDYRRIAIWRERPVNRSGSIRGGSAP
jgi:hypothetical protein